MTFSDAYHIASSLRSCANEIDGIITTLDNAIRNVNDGQSGIIPRNISGSIRAQIRLLEGIKEDINSAALIAKKHGDSLLNAKKYVTNPNSKIQQRVTDQNEPKKLQGKLVNIEQTK